MFSVRKGCSLVPIHDTLNDYELCCGLHDKPKCRLCRRYLGAYLYSNGNESMCNACVKKSTQRGGAFAYKVLREALEEHVIDGGRLRALL